MFHNRLAKGMRLQSDPTIILWDVATIGRNAHQYSQGRHLKPTAYNTYTIAALPVGPIANLGEDALASAMRPEKSPYLYFVSRNDEPTSSRRPMKTIKKREAISAGSQGAREQVLVAISPAAGDHCKSLSAGISAFGAKCWYRVAR